MASSEVVPSGTPGPGLGERRLFSWKAALPAGLIVLALLGAVFVVVLLNAQDASASNTDVYMDSDGRRLLFTVGSVQLLSASGDERRWVDLDPEQGERDTRDGPVRVASGHPEQGAFTEARITFQAVEAVQGSSLNTLRLLDDTVHVELPEEGRPGDALLIEFDGEASLKHQDDLWSFQPQVKRVSWHAGHGASGTVPSSPSGGGGASPPTSGGGGGSGGDGGDGGDGSGGGGGGSGGGGNDGGSPPTDIGRLIVEFEAESQGIIESLQASISKIALTPEDDPEATKVRFEGKKSVDFQQAADEEEGLWFTEFQVPAGNYSALQFEFEEAWVQLTSLSEADPAHVPQPLLVLEVAFEVPAGQNVTASTRLSVEESLRLGVEGYEFRPVVTSFSALGNHSGDLLAPYPPQYRTGGPWLPLLGQQTHDFLSENVSDPYGIPHPLWGDVERPPWAEGSLADIQPPQTFPYESCFADGDWCLSVSLMGDEETQDDPLSPLDGLGDSQPFVHDRALIVPRDPGASTPASEHVIEISEGSLRFETESSPRLGANIPMLLPKGDGTLDALGLFPVENALLSLDYQETGSACAEDACRFHLIDPSQADADAEAQAIGELRYARITVEGPATLSVEQVPVVVLK